MTYILTEVQIDSFFSGHEQRRDWNVLSIDTRSFADPDSIPKHSPEEAASEEGDAIQSSPRIYTN